MDLRSVGTHVLGAVIMTAAAATANAQVAGSAQSSSATHAAAEMTKGKLNPADSKPGDTVALKLKNDVRSNGEVVLRKGTTITGVVRNVKRAEANDDSKTEAKGQAQSMMEIEWLVPPSQGKAAQNLSIALQSVRQVNPIYQHEQESVADDFALAGAASGPIVDAGPAATRAGGQSNAALLSMPSVVLADHQTSSAIDGTFGTSNTGQLFKVGHGQLVTAGGSQQSVDLFSHLSNDTVITSPSKNFEISSGAEMQFLVGVNKK